MAHSKARGPEGSYIRNIARGHEDLAYPAFGDGYVTTAGASSNVQLWDGPTADQPYPIDAGIQLTLVSTLAADDKDAGTGAQSIELHYLDAAGVLQEEVILLEGVTPVATAATDIRFINSMHVFQAGSTGAAVGVITAKLSATVYGQINALNTAMKSSAYMVPVGYSLYVYTATYGASSGAGQAEVTVRIESDSLGLQLHTDVFLERIPVILQDGSLNYSSPVPQFFPSLAKVRMAANTDKAAVVAGSWSGIIERDS